MSTVVLAEDTLLGRQVALKRMHSMEDTHGGSRLRREALIGASVSHQNLVPIYDIVTEDGGEQVIVMEYVEGETLRDAVRREGRLDPQNTLRILGGVAAALDAIHAQGIVHRDVKPANILLGKDGSVKLADLGVASAPDRTAITTTGGVVGTFSYMAPEQLGGERATSSVDVYALAAVAFEALSGRKARSEPNPLALAHAIASGPEPDLRDVWPDAPTGAAKLLRRGMARNPKDRPKSAGELVARLRQALVPEATAAITPLERKARPKPAPVVPLPAPERPAEAVAPPAPRKPEPVSRKPQTTQPASRKPQPAARAPRAAAPPPPAQSAGDARRRWLILAAAIIPLIIAGAAVAAIATSGGSSSPHRSSGSGTHGASTPSTASHSASTPSHASSTPSSSASSSATAGSTNTHSAAASATPPAAASAGTSGATAGSPASAVERFYTLAAGHSYGSAWALADPTFQSQLGGYRGFQSTMSATRSITFDSARTVNQSAHGATVAVQTTSVRSNGTQHCTGTVQLVPGSGGGWLLHQIGINCT
jgi:serine/threonine-protein kinase